MLSILNPKTKNCKNAVAIALRAIKKEKATHKVRRIRLRFWSKWDETSRFSAFYSSKLS